VTPRRADSLLIRSPRWARTAPATPPWPDRSLAEHPKGAERVSSHDQGRDDRRQPCQPVPDQPPERLTACLLCVSCFVRERRGMTTATTPRHQVLTDKQWERIEPMLPSNTGRKGRPFHDNRKIVEGIIYRARTGIPWRDLPRE